MTRAANSALNERHRTVAVIGAGDPVGRVVAAQLAESDDIGRVIAIDARRGSLAGVTWRVVEPIDTRLEHRLRDIDTVVIAGVNRSVETDTKQRRQHNIEATDHLVQSAIAAGVKHLVCITSAMVYGAHADNAVPLDDDAPMRADLVDGFVADMLHIEDLVHDFATSGHGIGTTLRPAILVGEDVDTVLTRHFEAPRLLVVKDSRPLWQFVHVNDVATAVETVICHEIEGPVNLSAAGWLTQEEIEEQSQIRRLELPAALVTNTAERLHRVGVTPAPPGELQYVRYPWVINARKLRDAGWAPTVSNSEALAELLEAARGRTTIAGRRLRGSDAAASIGAAGATAALLGAAAVVRARRRRMGP